MNSKFIAEQIFLAGVESVSPGKIMRRDVYMQDTTLYISGILIPLGAINCIYVIGAGKASAMMAKEIEGILGNSITEGFVVVKYGHSCYLKHVKVLEAGHPEPDNNGYIATQKILEIANKAKENDLIICLISGGGSALLTDFPEGGNINDLVITNKLLLNSGASIKEMNTVRKHLSKVKGGQLAKTAYPGILISLILSDVVGDSIDTIASGPTAPDTTTFKDAIDVLQKYNLLEKIPEPHLNYIRNGVKNIHPETPKPDNPIFANTHNIIIGNNTIALEAARKKTVEFDMRAIIITSEFEGDTIKITDQIIETALKFQNDTTIQKPCCLLFGGETTLHIKGNGTGGRNQHMALYAALLLHDKKGITLLTGGTDGNDGPTSAAGAVVDTQSMQQASLQGIDINKYLKNFDSFHFFEKVGGHIITGPTMTNVMDLVVVIIE